VEIGTGLAWRGIGTGLAVEIGTGLAWPGIGTGLAVEIGTGFAWPEIGTGLAVEVGTGLAWLVAAFAAVNPAIGATIAMPTTTQAQRPCL
jgi:hypothetical protein